MVNSYYKINKDKIFFTDRRTDEFREHVHKIFDTMDIVGGIYNPTPRDLISGKYQENIDLVENIKRKVEDCRHKAIAARYHLALIKQETLNSPSEEDMKNYSGMIRHKMCNKAELKNDILIYETESFLFQIKTNLDIIIQLLKYIPEYNYLGLKNLKDKDSESFVFDRKKISDNTINKMIANEHTEMANFFSTQIDNWVRELNKMRNEITHRSNLKGFTSFVFDSDSEKVIHPQMPNGIEVNKYCTDIFDKLMILYQKVFQDFILPKLKF